ncbi:Bug family tripartite tricarboxylate transporter substrate binding protein [Candidimonas nitroreducens]|uniref:MFS transporter n=1 Tax=Candidimonas nitroreducens TaxID=683354 RepID=A0A225M649_9BURK|nr:tripartite tricarboxylate transporter substrate binding protein [Candidimonas nitroreducens]OWT56758.1 MFS transporter [Candidimonas nitroreducens]
MKLRSIGILAAAFGILSAASVPAARAATWPDTSVRYIVPFSPGGVSDAVARLVASQLGTRLGQSVIVENKPGVSGLVGTRYVAHAKPDGYTIMGGTITTHAVNPLFIKATGYDPVKDFVPVSLVGTVSNVLVVRKDSRFNTVRQIIAEAKAHPDKLTYGTAGLGSSQHLSGELFQSISGTHLRQIMYKGGSQAMVDLLGGQIDMVFETIAAARPMIDAHSVKVLGVTSDHPVADLPGVKPLAELGLPGFVMQSWQGVFAPAGTPRAIVQKLSKEIGEIVAQPDVRTKLLRLGVQPDGRGMQAFGQFQKDEIRKWTGIVQAAGIKPH